MNTEDLDKIQARADAATEGPWTTPGPDTVGQWMIYDKEWTIAEATAYDHNRTLSNRPEARGPAYIDPDANANFIAHARTDVPALLALVRSQQAQIERVVALADEWFRELDNPEHMIYLEGALDALRAALTATEGA